MKLPQNDLKHPYCKLFLAAFGMYLFSVIPILLFSGGVYLYNGDYNHQTIPFLEYLHRLLHSGNGLPAFDWNSALGMDFFCAYHDHLLSPYSWLLFAVPYAAVPYVHTVVVALKVAVGAMTGALWCRQYLRTDRAAFICGILYAFSGYQLFNLVYQFADRYSMFPLLLLTFDRLVQKRKPVCFALMLALNCLIDPLFAWMECLFIMIYYIVRTACGSFPKLTKGLFCQLAAECLIGVGVSAVMLLPFGKQLTGNSRANNLIFDYNLLAYEDAGVLLRAVQSMFLPPETCRNGWYFKDIQLSLAPPLLYIPVFTVVGVICVFRRSRKTWYSRLLTVCAVIACVPVLNSTFSAMNGNYYARWFFMPLLVMIMMTGMYIEDFDSYHAVQEMKINAGVLGFLGIFGIYSVFLAQKQTVMSQNLWCMGIVTAAAGLGILYLLHHPNPKLPYIRREKLLPIICIFCTVTFTEQAFALAENEGFERMRSTVDSVWNDFEPVTLDNSHYYRVVNTGSNINYSLMWDYPALNMFHSMVSGKESGFYDAVGLERRQSAKIQKKDYPLMSFLSTEYNLYFNGLLIGGIEVEPEDIPYHMEGFNDYTVHNRYVAYHNDAFIPMGFTYDHYLPLSDFQQADPDDLAETEKLIYEESDEEPDVAANEKLLLKAIWLTSEQIDRYGDILSPLPEELRADTSDEAYYADCKARAAGACYEFQTNNHGFTAKTNLPKENLVFFSVPASDGFTAYVDGQGTPIEEVFGGLSAVYVPAGDHSIEFRYETPMLRTGAVISVFSCGALLLYAAAVLLLNRRRKAPASAANEVTP